ncbi:MAG: glycosyltransferase [Acidobacteriaceae bacterium]|nr:glycosyltransferase [Acidobacteriaceae bacterium]
MVAHATLDQLAGTAPWPKISLVTPVFNSARYLDEAMSSVLDQGYPNLEYILVDGGSTDGSLDIIRKHASRLHWYTSEPDQGMYDALNKGFAHSSGEIMGWISATDKLHPGGLFVVGSVFRDLPDVDWITGIPTAFDEQGSVIRVAKLRRWTRGRFLAGANRYIQQESTFWRRGLWDRAGGHVDASRRMASDFELWVRFFRYARLYPVAARIGGFRVHSDSLGLQELDACHRIQNDIIERELASNSEMAGIRLFRRLSACILGVPALGALWRHTVMSALLRMPGPDQPPVIEYRSRWIQRT